MDLQTLKQVDWLQISDNVYRVIKDEYHKYVPLETMGALFILSGSTEWKIGKAITSGPKSEHKLWTCFVDIAYWNQKQRELHDEGYRICGQWHSHPFQDYPMPSRLDIVGHPGNPNDRGWQGYFKEEYEPYGWDGIINAIIARKAIRFWYVSKNDIQLVHEQPM